MKDWRSRWSLLVDKDGMDDVDAGCGGGICLREEEEREVERKFIT